MNDFATDYAWQKMIRERLLLPHYDALHKNQVFAQWRSSQTKNEEMRGDALFKMHDDTVIGVEEKIVRWPKRNKPYTAIPLETLSCSVPGHEKDGWMITARYDWLLHIRVNNNETSAECDGFEFSPLKMWFTEQDHDRWPLHQEKEGNQTESRIVPLIEIRPITRSFQFELPFGGVKEIFAGKTVCAQCGAGVNTYPPTDAPTVPFGGVLLHPECLPFYDGSRDRWLKANGY